MLTNRENTVYFALSFLFIMAESTIHKLIKRQQVSFIMYTIPVAINLIIIIVAISHSFYCSRKTALAFYPEWHVCAT